MGILPVLFIFARGLMIIERYFFIIRQPFAGSPSFEEVEVCVPTILPGGLA
jgi:hypothetical protein